MAMTQDLYFSDGLGGYSQNWSRFGYLATDGRVAISPKFDMTYPFHGDRAVVHVDGGYRLIDRSGEFVCSELFNRLDPGDLRSGLYVARQGSDSGFVDRNGNKVFWGFAGGCGPFSEGIAVVKKQDQEGYSLMDLEGRILCDLNCEYLGEYSHGMISAWDPVARQAMYLDRRGKVVIHQDDIEDFGHGQFYGFHCGLSSYQDTVKEAGYFNCRGKVVIPARFRRAHPFSEGFAVVGECSDAVGFIDIHGRPICEFQYADAESFHEGMAAVAESYRDEEGDLQLRWGFVNTRGELAIPMRFAAVGRFSCGLALVVEDDSDGGSRTFYIDVNGKPAFPAQV
jgi:hypothetical protein